MNIRDSFKQDGSDQKMKVIIDNNKEKSVLDKICEILANKYLWMVVAAIIALIFGYNFFD